MDIYGYIYGYAFADLLHFHGFGRVLERVLAKIRYKSIIAFNLTLNKVMTLFILLHNIVIQIIFQSGEIYDRFFTQHYSHYQKRSG
jgi:hypothetical protein